MWAACPCAYVSYLSFGRTTYDRAVIIHQNPFPSPQPARLTDPAVILDSSSINSIHISCMIGRAQSHRRESKPFLPHASNCSKRASAE